MCNIGHNSPCWRDPDFEGPLPLRVWKNPEAMKSIEADRLKNATRLGTTCKKLKPSSKHVVDTAEAREILFCLEELLSAIHTECAIFVVRLRCSSRSRRTC